MADALEYERYREHMRYLRRCRHMIDFNPQNEVESFFYLLLLPLIVLAKIAITVEEYRVESGRQEFECKRMLQIWEFKAMKWCARDGLRAHDEKYNTKYLDTMDSLVREAAYEARDFAVASEKVSFDAPKNERFATIEEIYGKLFEPSFRKFQNKQRPCRRYEGSYLEYIREGQLEMALKKKENRNTRNRRVSEAIELVIGIGDMDNTGYAAAYEDARKSETILKDYCDHLMKQRNICFITTTELDDPNWQPPFKHGLIVVNLTVHCDEATPGIHLTVIPYSSGCKRGPDAQASLGRAMTGMGYPSTWKDVRNEKGERLPKRNKRNEIVLNQDGTIRYLQEPDQQGIIDWIEDQKAWIQTEMEHRYGWEREFKGSHSRGNLSTPDYQAARAAERRQEMEERIRNMYDTFVAEINVQISRLDAVVDQVWQSTTDWEKLMKYLKECPEEEYWEYVKRARNYLDTLPIREQERIKKQIDDQILAAQKKSSIQVAHNKSEHSHLQEIQ